MSGGRVRIIKGGSCSGGDFITFLGILVLWSCHCCDGGGVGVGFLVFT